MKTKLALLLLILAALALLHLNGYCACTNNQTSGAYLGWGYPPKSGNPVSVSFPNGAGTFTIPASGLEWDVDSDSGTETCSPSTWNYNTVSGPFMGTISYNDGEISYSGKAKLWFHMHARSGSVCSDGGPDMRFTFERVKIQSCTVSGVLTNKLIAVGCDGCDVDTAVPCLSPSGAYIIENWINMTVSGF